MEGKTKNSPHESNYTMKEMWEENERDKPAKSQASIVEI